MCCFLFWYDRHNDVKTKWDWCMDLFMTLLLKLTCRQLQLRGLNTQRHTISVSFPKGKLSIVWYRPAFQKALLHIYLTFCLALDTSDSKWWSSNKGNYYASTDMTIIILNVNFRLTSSKVGLIIRTSTGNAETCAYNNVAVKNTAIKIWRRQKWWKKAYSISYHPLSLLRLSHFFIFLTHHSLRSFLFILLLLLNKAPEYVGHKRIL
jgi:hypothetical protein